MFITLIKLIYGFDYFKIQNPTIFIHRAQIDIY